MSQRRTVTVDEESPLELAAAAGPLEAAAPAPVEDVSADNWAIDAAPFHASPGPPGPPTCSSR
ncbi:hypothetical protein [Streptomyces sp. NPDC006285]|uniref:hypothetical protein n=1 Tax=Streptomyces sp. NPDC006285 TaxID=3364742 RepID=UPI0036A080DD